MGRFGGSLELQRSLIQRARCEIGLHKVICWYRGLNWDAAGLNLSSCVIQLCRLTLFVQYVHVFQVSMDFGNLSPILQFDISDPDNWDLTGYWLLVTGV